jgi:hypothetical protein
MIDVDEFGTWDLKRWLSEFANGLGPDDIRQEGWLAAVQRLAFLLDLDHGVLGAHEWRLASDAMFKAIRFAEQVGAIDHRESVLRQMSITLLMLRSHPPDDDIEMLSPRGVLRLFDAELPLSMEEAKSRQVDWNNPDIDELRELRIVKQLVARAIEVRKYITDEARKSELDRWAEIHPRLP